MTAPAAATPKVERLVNLTIALLEARRAMTLDEIKRRTGYYDQDDTASARRMFERDKDALRQLGVPIITETDPATGELGYRAPRKSYELPDVALDADEVAALALAVRLADVDRTHLALAKLAARAPDPTTIDPEPLRVGMTPDGPLDALADAIIDRCPVGFGYRKADGSEGRRTLDAYAVVRRRGAWYVVGRDHDRDAVRAFRLDRILDVPRTAGTAGAFERPEDLDPVAAVRGPEVTGVELEVAVALDARWELEARGASDTGRLHGDRPVLALPGFDPIRDRGWLLGLGSSVVVLAPAALREDVVRALRSIVEAADEAVRSRGGQ